MSAAINPGPKPKRLADRIMAHVQFEANTGCWLWDGARDAAGYGRILRGSARTKRRMASAHRASWLAFMDSEPGALHVLHRCDTPACVNPAHLFLGTHQENIADCVAKGRARRVPVTGATHPNAKLTDAEVTTIRELAASGNASQREMAAVFGVSQGHISNIVRNVWRAKTEDTSQ